MLAPPEPSLRPLFTHHPPPISARPSRQGLPECVKATGTTKVFESYLTCLTYNQQSSRIGVCGDNGFKASALGCFCPPHAPPLRRDSPPARPPAPTGPSARGAPAALSRPHARLHRAQVITRKASNQLEVLADITLDYKLSIGNHLDSLKWSPDGSALAVTATDGYVWWHAISERDVRGSTES